MWIGIIVALWILAAVVVIAYPQVSKKSTECLDETIDKITFPNTDYKKATKTRCDECLENGSRSDTLTCDTCLNDQNKEKK